MKFRLLAIITSFLLLSSVKAQHFDVEGDGRIVGKLELIQSGEDSSVYIGSGSGMNTMVPIPPFDLYGLANTFVGTNTGKLSTIGRMNTLVGFNAGMTNSGSANKNTLIGANSGKLNTGFENTFIGNDSGLSNTSGYHNTFLGERSGRNNDTGIGNTFIGHDSGSRCDNQSPINSIAIGKNSKVACSNCAVIGGEGNNAVNVGIGTSLPETELHIEDTNDDSYVQIKLENHSHELLLSIDPDHNSSIIESSHEVHVNSPITVFNGGTDVNVSSGGYISVGATNNRHIAIDNNEIQSRNNNVTAALSLQAEGGDLYLNHQGGKVGIGTTDPSDKLDVNGSIHIKELIKLEPSSEPYACNQSRRGEIYYDQSDFKLKVCTVTGQLNGFFLNGWVALHN